MEKYWRIKKIPPRAETGSVSGGKYSSIILDLLRIRGVEGEEKVGSFFDFSYEQGVLDPFLFKDMEKAVRRIEQARERGEKVAIFGDYDADGVTASAIMFEALAGLGFEDIPCYIPDRQLEGYGMNEKAIDYLHQEGVKLIITVDCGITNVSEVEKAKTLGIDVVITDHHHVPEVLPEALAILNPHIRDCGYPSEDLAGVGVAFKLAQGLYQRLLPEQVDQLKWGLDLVAVGTIADCVDLLGENRVLTRYGLLVLSKTRRSGLLEMFKVGRVEVLEGRSLDSHQVSFQIAPRINAAGRMDHANVAYNLLIEKDRSKARLMALEVEEKNQERQKTTGEIVREIRIVADNSFKDKKLIFAHNEHWPVGILGLIAGKITDEYAKPTIILQKQEQEFVGSLRSVDEVNIMEALNECADLIIRFGGHAQAAGVRVSKDNIEEFYERLSGAVEKRLSGDAAIPHIEIDMEITPAEISWELVEEIRKMEPFGEGNEEPVFLIKSLKVADLKVVGNGSKHLKLQLRDGGGGPKIFDSIGFGLGERFSDLRIDDTIEIVANLKEDEWNGNKKIQLKIIDLKKT